MEAVVRGLRRKIVPWPALSCRHFLELICVTTNKVHQELKRAIKYFGFEKGLTSCNNKYAFPMVYYIERE